MLSRRYFWLIVLALATIVGALLVVETPTMANSFGYALPGREGLPFRVEYHGRHYRSYATCAGADWCQSAGSASGRTGSVCQDLRPKIRDAALVTLFGRPRGIFINVRPGPGQTVTQIFVEADQDCYVAYTLMGGP